MKNLGNSNSLLLNCQQYEDSVNSDNFFFGEGNFWKLNSNFQIWYNDDVCLQSASLGTTSPIDYDSEYAEPGYPIGQNFSSYAAQSTDCNGKFGAECLIDCQTLMV